MLLQYRKVTSRRVNKARMHLLEFATIRGDKLHIEMAIEIAADLTALVGLHGGMVP